MKLIKDGKVFDLSTAKLIATSNEFVDYGTRQRRIYQSVNGNFFITETCNFICLSSGKVDKQYHHPDELIKSVPTLEQVRDIFEYTLTGKSYYVNQHNSLKYDFHVKYEDLFELVEG